MIRICAILVWTVVATSWVAIAAGDATRGENVYATACAGCHASVSRIARGIVGSTPKQKAVWLELFLSEHHPPDIAARTDLIAFLLTK